MYFPALASQALVDVGADCLWETWEGIMLKVQSRIGAIAFAGQFEAVLGRGSRIILWSP